MDQRNDVKFLLDSIVETDFLVPTVAGLVAAVVLAILGIHHLAALISFGLCAFVLTSIIGEFWKGSRAIQAKEHLPLAKALQISGTARETMRLCTIVSPGCRSRMPLAMTAVVVEPDTG